MSGRVIVVTYWYRPEATSPRAHQAYGIARGFRRQGVEVDIVFPRIGGVEYKPEKDPGFREHPVKPGFLLHREKYQKKAEAAAGKAGIKGKVVAWVGENLVWPDRTVEYGIEAYRYIVKNLDPAGARAVISVGLPMSAHITGCALKRKFVNLRWVADYGDPFTFRRGLDIARTRDVFLESRMLKMADAVTVPWDRAVPCYTQLGVERSKIHVIPQLFCDEVDESVEYEVSRDCFNIMFVGMFPNLDYGARELMEAVRILSERGARPVFHMFGWSGTAAKKIEEMGLAGGDDRFRLNGYIPRERLLAIMKRMNALVGISPENIAGIGRRPSKYVDYVRAGVPILNIGTPMPDLDLPTADCESVAIAAALNDIREGRVKCEYEGLRRRFDYSANFERFSKLAIG